MYKGRMLSFSLFISTSDLQSPQFMKIYWKLIPFNFPYELLWFANKRSKSSTDPAKVDEWTILPDEVFLGLTDFVLRLIGRSILTIIWL